MRIVHSLFTNAVGGTERHLAQLANEQVRRGHEVSVILRGSRNPYDLEEDPLLNWLSESIKIYTAPKYWPFSRWPLWPLRFLLWKLQPDIIHTHHGRDNRYMAKAANGMCPVIATLHMPYKYGDLKHHDGLICVSKWQLRDIPESAKVERVVIPNWVKPTPATDRLAVDMLRAELGLESGDFLIGAVGRLVESKGMDDLIKAFLAANLPNTKLCIIGEGEQRGELEALISKEGTSRIHLMGYREDIRYCYDAFDLFVLPSRHETFGLVLLEAMVAGCPIITTRTDGAIDILGENKQTIWAEPGKVQSLFSALCSARPVMGERWLYPELEKHNFHKASDAVLEFYEKLLSAKTQPEAVVDESPVFMPSDSRKSA